MRWFRQMLWCRVYNFRLIVILSFYSVFTGHVQLHVKLWGCIRSWTASEMLLVMTQMAKWFSRLHKKRTFFTKTWETLAVSGTEHCDTWTLSLKPRESQDASRSVAASLRDAHAPKRSAQVCLHFLFGCAHLFTHRVQKKKKKMAQWATMRYGRHRCARRGHSEITVPNCSVIYSDGCSERQRSSTEITNHA